MGNGTMRPKNWFSRRHETDTEHRAAVADYKENRGPNGRRKRAQERVKKS